MKPVTAFLCSLSFLWSVLPSGASEVSKEDIVCALNPNCSRPLTRTMGRGVTSTGGAAAAPLSIDLYVNFAYDSAELASDARITLDQLGAALRDRRLDGYTFLIAGHTDARGSAEYNQRLSERRAESVRRYLIAQYGIGAERLSTRGYGKSQLLDPARPEDGVNRRVQVVNVTASSRR